MSIIFQLRPICTRLGANEFRLALFLPFKCCLRHAFFMWVFFCFPSKLWLTCSFIFRLVTECAPPFNEIKEKASVCISSAAQSDYCNDRFRVCHLDRWLISIVVVCNDHTIEFTFRSLYVHMNLSIIKSAGAMLLLNQLPYFIRNRHIHQTKKNNYKLRNQISLQNDLTWN